MLARLITVHYIIMKQLDGMGLSKEWFLPPDGWPLILEVPAHGGQSFQRGRCLPACIVMLYYKAMLADVLLPAC